MPNSSCLALTHAHATSVYGVQPPARYAADLLTPAFASNLENLMGGDRAALWFHEHMHDAFDYQIYGTRVVCNPRGYAPNALTTEFRPDYLIEIWRIPDFLA
jgi:hypothetical protein